MRFDLHDDLCLAICPWLGHDDFLPTFLLITIDYDNGDYYDSCDKNDKNDKNINPARFGFAAIMKI